MAAPELTTSASGPVFRTRRRAGDFDRLLTRSRCGRTRWGLGAGQADGRVVGQHRAALYGGQLTWRSVRIELEMVTRCVGQQPTSLSTVNSAST